MEFETLLRNNEALSREIAEMRRIDRQLTGLGADILDEPIPEALLEALAQLEADEPGPRPDNAVENAAPKSQTLPAGERRQAASAAGRRRARARFMPPGPCFSAYLEGA